MKVKMPDGVVIDGVPEGMSRAEVLYKYQQSQMKPEYSPVTTGPVGTAMIGAGDMFNSMGAGVQNLYAKGTGNEPMQQQLAAQQAESSRLMAPLQEEQPGALMAGRMLPGLATAPIPGGLLTQMGIGGAMGAAEYGENQGLQGVLGGALSGVGYGVGQLLGKAVNVVRGARKGIQAGNAPPPSGMRGDMATKARELGMELLPGDETGLKQLRRIDTGIKRNPATVDLVSDTMENNQRILNRTAIEAMGETGDEVTENMLGKAAKRIGDVYDSLLKDVDEIPIDPTRIESISDDMAQDSLPYIKKYLERFPSLQEGAISGKEAGRLRNLIQKDMRLVSKNFKADPDDLRKFQEVIMDAAEAASGKDADVLKTAGQQWRIMKALERGNTVTEGNVNAKSLRTGLSQFDTRYKRGLLENQQMTSELQRLYDATKVANYFQDVVGDPGTSNALQAADFLDPKTFIQRQLMRRGAKSYLENGNVPYSLGILQGAQQPVSPMYGQGGAGIMRGLMGANQ